MTTRRKALQISVIVTLALRNLRRQVRRTLLTALAIILGAGMLVFANALGDGTHEQWIDDGVRAGSGHVTIEHPAFRMSRKLEDRLVADVRAVAEVALATPALADRITGVSAQLTINGMASSAAGARPAQILAVDPQAEIDFTILDEQVIEGRYLQSDDRLAAFVGVGLMETLNLRLGSRLVLTAQDADKEIAGQLVRVVGVFRNGAPPVDNAVVHIPLAVAGEWLGSGSDVSNIAVMVEDSTEVSSLVRDLRQALADPLDAGRVTVLSWREAMPALASLVAVDQYGNYVIFGVLFIIIALGIVNTVLMSVLHRHREFGVLQALGLTPRQTGTVVLIEGLLLTTLSTLVGVGLSTWLTWYFLGDGFDMAVIAGDALANNMDMGSVVIDPIIVPMFSVARTLQTLGWIMLMGILSSIYPAFRAARIDVAESMKFDR
jgi:ABC-type lipoprotein release transport system permease subunit